MANYTISNGSTTGGGTQQATAAAYTSATIGITAPSASPRRGKIYDVLVGTNGAPADNFMEFDISRVTASSTSTTLAANPLDSADAAATSVVTVNSSAFATIGTPALWYIGMNQRASYRWVCAPGSELVWPATGSNGYQLRPRSGSYTGTVTGNIMFQEQ